MSRAIKFRAWDTINNVFLEDVQEMYDGWDVMHYFESFGDVIRDAYCIVEEYTGLHDKKGNEIYEGDILENSKYRSVVKFGPGSFYADVIGAVNRFPIAGEQQTSIVIGNVHANPELLEAEK